MSKLIILGIGGDSITGCSDIANCYPYQGLNVSAKGSCSLSFTQAWVTYNTILSGIPVLAKNLGVSGARLATMTDNMTSVAQTYGDPMITTSGGSVAGGGATVIPQRRYVYSVLAGSNDGCLDGTVAQFVADVVAFCAARKAAGWNAVIIGTVLPRTDAGGPMTDSNRVIYNSTITAAGWAAANGIDGVFDLASDTIMGNIANCSNPTYYNSDQIHPTTAGHARLAPIWGATLSSVISGL
jgi:lysophospholipase L1-like esterase